MQQAPMFSPKAPLQFTPQQVQELQQQQQLHQQPQIMPFQGHMGLRPAGIMNGMQAAAATHTESSHGGATNEVPSGGAGLSEALQGSTLSSSVDGRGSKQDAGSAASEHAATAADSQKNSTEQGSGDAEPPSNPKRPDDSKTP